MGAFWAGFEMKLVLDRAAAGETGLREAGGPGESNEDKDRLGRALNCAAAQVLAARRAAAWICVAAQGLACLALRLDLRTAANLAAGFFAARRASEIAQPVTPAVAASEEEGAINTSAVKQKNSRFGFGQVAYFVYSALIPSRRGRLAREGGFSMTVFPRLVGST